MDVKLGKLKKKILAFETDFRRRSARTSRREKVRIEIIRDVINDYVTIKRHRSEDGVSSTMLHPFHTNSWQHITTTVHCSIFTDIQL
jgi:hypothetical protein